MIVANQNRYRREIAEFQKAQMEAAEAGEEQAGSSRDYAETRGPVRM